MTDSSETSVLTRITTFRKNEVVYIKPLICLMQIFNNAGSLRIFLKNHFFSNSILCFPGIKYFAIINNRARY